MGRIGMAELEEDLVSFEIAKYIDSHKQKLEFTQPMGGINIELYYAGDDGKYLSNEKLADDSHYVYAPTQSIIIKWLRRYKNIYIGTYRTPQQWNVVITKCPYDKSTWSEASTIIYNGNPKPTYHETINEAIMYVLKMLVEDRLK